MDIFTLCGCAIVICALITTVRQQRAEIAVLLTAAAGVILLAYILKDMPQTVGSLRDMLSELDGFSGETGAVLRAAGACLAAQLTADVCRDAGQTTVAARVELGGRIAALMLILPVLESVLRLSAQITGGAV